MSNDATSDVTAGQMVPWAEYDKVRCDAHVAMVKRDIEIDRLRAMVRRLRLAIEAHQVQSVGWRPTTEVDRELWAHGAHNVTEVTP